MDEILSVSSTKGGRMSFPLENPGPLPEIATSMRFPSNAGWHFERRRWIIFVAVDTTVRLYLVNLERCAKMLLRAKQTVKSLSYDLEK